MRRADFLCDEGVPIRRYETGHDLNDLWVLSERAQWLERQLCLEPTRPLLEKQLAPDVN